MELMGGPIQMYAGLGGGRAAQQPAKPNDAQREAQLAKCRELRRCTTTRA